MKVLFINSANGRDGISPIVKAQGRSLEIAGVEVGYFPLIGKGIKGYIANIPLLKTYIRTFNPDIIHAHYSLSGFLASFCTRKPVIVSIMGSFPRKSIKLFFVRFFSKLLWKETIVKSELTRNQIGFQNLHIIPNGVDTEVFFPQDMVIARKRLGLNPEKQYVLFAAETTRPEKNYELAQMAFLKIAHPDIELLSISGVSHFEISMYLSAVDVLILTSLNEGSPNIIKEAMCCNCPIVTSNVGDVERTIGNTEGCVIINGYNPDDYSKAIEFVLNRNMRTNGQQRIIELELDSNIVAKKIINLYTKYDKKNQK